MTLEGAPGTMLYQMSVLGWLQLSEYLSCWEQVRCEFCNPNLFYTTLAKSGRCVWHFWPTFCCYRQKVWSRWRASDSVKTVAKVLYYERSFWVIFSWGWILRC